MIGSRKDNPSGLLPKKGEYGLNAAGEWFGMTPNGHLANLTAHKIEESLDGTITVNPSIMVMRDGIEVWHGFLRQGRWESCGHYWNEN